MKIKCASCELKIISFKDAILSLHTICPNCGSHLDFKSTKAYLPLAFLNIIFIFYIVFKIVNGRLNEILGYLIVTIVFSATLFFTTQTIKRKTHVAKNPKSFKKKLILKLTIVFALFYDLTISDKTPHIAGLQIFLIVGFIYMIYTIIKNKKM